MDQVAAILKNELHRMLIDGIKYERIAPDTSRAAWEMTLFDNEELINYLNALQVNKSVYDHVVYDSEVEREFARQLDEREDIKLFVQLPSWFKIETPDDGIRQGPLWDGPLRGDRRAVPGGGHCHQTSRIT